LSKDICHYSKAFDEVKLESWLHQQESNGHDDSYGGGSIESSSRAIPGLHPCTSCHHLGNAHSLPLTPTDTSDKLEELVFRVDILHKWMKLTASPTRVEAVCDMFSIFNKLSITVELNSFFVTPSARLAGVFVDKANSKVWATVRVEKWRSSEIREMLLTTFQHRSYPHD
jgi:hypothetical protein